MKHPSNKAKSIYLFWVFVQAILWITNTNSFSWAKKEFFPFTSSIYTGRDNFDLNFYDITEFLFYTISPILIYYAIAFWKKPSE